MKSLNLILFHVQDSPISNISITKRIHQGPIKINHPKNHDWVYTRIQNSLLDIFHGDCFSNIAKPTRIGTLHDPLTCYKITHAGEQVAQWDLQNKGRSRWTGTSCFVLEVPLCNLLTSMCDFVPCDWIVQRAYLTTADENQQIIKKTYGPGLGKQILLDKNYT